MKKVFQESTEHFTIKKMAINSKTYFVYKNQEFTLTRPISYSEIVDLYLLAKSFLKDVTINSHIYFNNYLSPLDVSKENREFVEKIKEVIK